MRLRSLALRLTAARSRLAEGCFLLFFTPLPCGSTSRRFLTAYPSGSVPSVIIRSGQRAHLGLLVQHFTLGRRGALVVEADGTGATVARTVRFALPQTEAGNRPFEPGRVDGVAEVHRAAERPD